MDDEYFFVPLEGRRYQKILSKQLIYIKGGKDYRKLVTERGIYHTKATMDWLSTQINANKFFRIHRSYIISVTHLETFDYCWVTILGEELPISDTYRKSFFGKLIMLS